MSDWQWECLERYVRSELFSVSDPGPLLSPIRAFKITRDNKLNLVLETLAIGEVQASRAPVYPNGTIRLNAEKIEFTGNSGMRCTATGVLPFTTRETHTDELEKQYIQKAQVHSLTARLRNDVDPAYTIDWLGNLDTGAYVWRGSIIREEHEVVDTLTLGHDHKSIKLSTRATSFPNTNFSSLEMVIAGVRLFLCNQAPQASNKVERPGYIFYVGNPTDEIRKKIRQVLSFCLGNYLVYLGSTTLSEKSEIVSLYAISPPSIGRVSEIPVLPPSFLGNGNTMIAEPEIVAGMANAVYAHYDELRFDSFSWAYWHAMCAPIHMAAGHFGATIEALQIAYKKAHSEKISTALIADKTIWESLKKAILKSIDDENIEKTAKDVLRNKIVNNLNQAPQVIISDRILSLIGIKLGEAETKAWARRNAAAHGGEIDIDSAVPAIMQTKLLKIILHRMVLKITGASDCYYDDYSIGHAIRKVTDPVPSQPPAQEPR